MCGLVAVVSNDDSDIDLGERDPFSVLSDMIYAIRHRGPDGSGVSINPRVMFGHVRLSIVGGDQAAQPMIRGGLEIVFNGEIYNYKELAENRLDKSLVGKNLLGDTEVILEMYKKYGTNSFVELNGMFSFVIYDKRSNLVISCRDRFGVKPFYIADDINGQKVMASEISALKAFSRENMFDIDPLSIDNYVRLGYVVEPKTIYKKIRQLPAGVFETHDLNTNTTLSTRYYNPLDFMVENPKNISDCDGKSMLKNSIHRQGFIDKPIDIDGKVDSTAAAVFLSSGLDSSIIAKFMSTRSDELDSFTIGFDEKQFSEVDEVENFTKREKINSHVKVIDRKILHNADFVVKIFDSPFADNASIPTYHLASSVSDKGYKVALSGDGADELFYGYRNHRMMFVEHKIKKLIPNAVRKHVIGKIAKFYPDHKSIPRFLRGKSTLTSLSLSFQESYCEAMSLTNSFLVNKLYSESFKKKIKKRNTIDEFNEIADEFYKSFDKTASNDMKLMQFIDLKTYLPGAILQKTDRAAMRSGVEVRVPFLDNEIVNTALGTPYKLNLGITQHKSKLRSWVSNDFCEEERNRVKKSFTSPLDKWFRTIDYHRFIRMVVSESLIESNIFDVDCLRVIMDEHYYGKRNHGSTLWSLVVLSKFLDEGQLCGSYTTIE